MPIRFRCSKCSRLLGISRRKAGQETICPQCGAQIMVPPLDDDLTERLEAPMRVPPPPAVVPGPAAAVLPAPPPARAEALPLDPLPPPPPRPAAAPTPPDRATEKHRTAPPKKPLSSETPLFEEMDFDEMLGVKGKPAAAPIGATSGKPAVPGVDALSLDDGGPQPVILSPRRATLLVVAVVVLLAFAFAAGYLIAPSAGG